MKLNIIIKGATPGNNNLYVTSRKGFRFMPKKIKALKEEIIELVMEQSTKQQYVQPEWSERLLEVHTTIHENWYNRNGSIKKKDLVNKEKFLIDSVMSGLRLDDSQVWKHTMEKVDVDLNDKESFRSEITIEFYQNRLCLISPTLFNKSTRFKKYKSLK